MLVGTDGSCLRNPGGATGWAFAFENGYWEAGGLTRGTNQVGELLGVLMLLRSFPYLDLTIQSDSAYTIGACTKWKRSWQRKNYVRDDGSDRPNKNIIVAIHHLLDTSQQKIEFVKVPGHDPQNRFPLNTNADDKAKRAAREAKRKGTEVLLKSQGISAPTLGFAGS